MTIKKTRAELLAWSHTAAHAIPAFGVALVSAGTAQHAASATDRLAERFRARALGLRPRPRAAPAAAD